MSWDRGIPFSIPFRVSAHGAKIWVQPHSQNASIRGIWNELHIKGANWAGFQANGCVHELWKHTVDDYIQFLVVNGFNAVRLPLNARIVAAHSWPIAGSFICGSHYQGWQSIQILDDVLLKLQQAGIFVMLDMHTSSYPEHNDGMWLESLVFDAWHKLATRYCSRPNVIMAGMCVSKPIQSPKPEALMCWPCDTDFNARVDPLTRRKQTSSTSLMMQLGAFGKISSNALAMLYWLYAHVGSSSPRELADVAQVLDTSGVRTLVGKSSSRSCWPYQIDSSSRRMCTDTGIMTTSIRPIFHQICPEFGMSTLATSPPIQMCQS